jgi:aldose sugar dehydrogenase
MYSNKLSLTLLIALCSVSLWTSCGPKEPAVASTEETFAIQTERLLIKVDTLYSDFENPWGMTWIGDGKMLVTERKGEILIFQDDKFTGEKIQGLPAVHAVNQA